MLNFWTLLAVYIQFAILMLQAKHLNFKKSKSGYCTTLRFQVGSVGYSYVLVATYNMAY